MNAARVNNVAGVILAAQKTRQTAAGIAMALEAACLLQSPESAAEAVQLNADVTGACLARWEVEQENARLRLALASAKRGRRELRARVAELEAQAGGYTARDLVTALVAAGKKRDEQIIAWLVKKASEYRGLPSSRQESAADAIARMADKLSRGAVRPSIPTPAPGELAEQRHLMDPLDDTLTHLADGGVS